VARAATPTARALLRGPSLEGQARPAGTGRCSWRVASCSPLVSGAPHERQKRFLGWFSWLHRGNGTCCSVMVSLSSFPCPDIFSRYTSPMMHGDRPDVIMRFANAVSSEEGEMSIFPTKILLATDGSSESELATRTAVDLGQQTNSELHLIHVWDIATTALLYPGATDPEGVELPDPILEEDLERSAEHRGREVLDEEVERVRSAGGTVAQAHLMMGEAAREIIHLAEDLGAGLVVMGSRGRRGIRRALMGSVSDSVVRHAHCPVLVVRE
jgi:nucleotide-binding universal stress UspA family protein